MPRKLNKVMQALVKGKATSATLTVCKKEPGNMGDGGNTWIGGVGCGYFTQLSLLGVF